MPNNYFQFKKFTVYQDRCAMKVCTDACLFGAYIANAIKDMEVAGILDIGTGTGLLPLMLAQQTNAAIDTIEIDKAAYEQASDNIQQSPWAERITVFNEDVNDFDEAKQYDLIISNPPFFEGDLKSVAANKNAAKHDTTLTLSQLLQSVKKHLHPGGLFAALLPYHRVNDCIAEAGNAGLFLSEKVLVKQTPSHNYFRGILIFSHHQMNIGAEEILIRDEKGNYSDQFIDLLKLYYLHL